MDEQVRIICVDDEVNVLKALERIFLDEDYELYTAASAAEGLEVLEKVKPVQIVISDYRMPVMNGVDFLKEVCQRWPHTVRIVLSGYADAAAIVGAINEGQIYKFIPKPWNDDELRVTIANAIELYFLHKKNRELLEELQSKNEELEKRVEAKIADILFQNRVLSRTQNIVDALPVGIVGIDNQGFVVQVNGKAAELLGVSEGSLIGQNRVEVLPSAINEFIQCLCLTSSEVDGCVELETGKLRVKGICMSLPDQEGVIIVIDRVDANE